MRYFNFIAAILLTILYAIGKIPPAQHYNLWLTSFLIPFALATNILFLVISLALRKKSSLYYIITLVIGSNYLLSTFGVKYIFKDKNVSSQTFNLLSYNINFLRGHDANPVDFDRLDSNTVMLKNWIIDRDAEIQCYQEFMNHEDNKEFNLISILTKKGYHCYFSYDSFRTYRSVSGGILIASKFPIINSGDVVSSENGFNRVAFADLNIGNDTVRVVNVHLESMGLKSYNPVYKAGFGSRKEHTKIILSKLKEGVFERSKQIKILAKFIESSPHPVICVGDFNDMPYSYSYQFMKKRMKNAFEEVGKGLGFTYNGKTLRVLRIDNQFYTPPLNAVRFGTLNDIPFSDHFPLLGTYTVKR